MVIGKESAVVLSRWLVSTHHISVGSLYIISGVWSAGVGAGLSWLMRKEISCKGSWLGSEQLYYSIVTAHALIMVLFVVMPVLGAGLGNWLIPLMCIHKDMSFPRMNALSLWTVLPALVLLVSSLSVEGGSGTGWTVYPPLSSEGHGGLSVDAAILALHTAGASSLMGAMNLLTTLHSRMEGVQSITATVLSWCIGVMSLLLLVSLPVLAGGVTLLLLDRNVSASFYVLSGGGDPILYQHLLWLLGHPEVYILILPGLGVITHAVVWGVGSHMIYGRGGLVVAVGVIGMMGCFVWAHHMVTVGLDLDTRAYLMAVTLGIALPTGIKLYSWNASMLGNAMRWGVVTMWAYGLMCLLTLGGTTGVVLANTVIDIVLHDTLLVVGHFHYVLSMGAIMSMGTGLCLWGSVFSGVVVSKLWGSGGLMSLFIGVNLIFLPTHLVGLSGGPRRLAHLPDLALGWLKISTYGSVMSLNGFMIILLSLLSGWLQLRVISSTQSSSSMMDILLGSIGSPRLIPKSVGGHY